MLEDFSCGVVPYRVVEGRREFLLIQHRAGHWAFPKGHPEKGESYLQTARRELAEETGIEHIELDERQPFEERYEFTKHGGMRVSKRVLYYVGRVGETLEVELQASEVSDYSWGDAAQTRARLSFDAGRALLDAVLAYLDA